MRLCDVRSGRAVFTMERVDDNHALRNAFAGDGRLLRSIGAANDVVITDLRNQCTMKLISGHSKVISSLHFVGGVPSSGIFVSVVFDGTVKLWAVVMQWQSHDCHLYRKHYANRKVHHEDELFDDNAVFDEIQYVSIKAYRVYFSRVLFGLLRITATRDV